MKIKKGIKLSTYTTIHIGGKARYFVDIYTTRELIEAIQFFKSEGIEYFVLGGGSNLLIDDRNLDLAVVKLHFNNIHINNTTITVAASFKLPKLIHILSEEELSGLEELTEIPGEVGGAIFMNAGSFGKEIGEVVEKLEVFNGKEFTWLSGKELGFSYRKSSIKKGWIITQVVLKLVRGNSKNIKKTILKVKEQRRISQPVGEKTFGSVFKNPSNFSAGYLIDQCRLKGYSINDAIISEKHANFIINRGKARFNDIMKLMGHMQKTVQNAFGVFLEPEVIVIREG